MADAGVQRSVRDYLRPLPSGISQGCMNNQSPFSGLSAVKEGGTNGCWGLVSGVTQLPGQKATASQWISMAKLDLRMESQTAKSNHPILIPKPSGAPTAPIHYYPQSGSNLTRQAPDT